MNLARAHRVVLSGLLIAACVAYSLLSFLMPQVATALGTGFIGFVGFAVVVLRVDKGR